MQECAAVAIKSKAFGRQFRKPGKLLIPADQDINIFCKPSIAIRIDRVATNDQERQIPARANVIYDLKCCHNGF